MSDIDDLYNQRIFEIAAAMPDAVRLPSPSASATANSKLCGSTITVDMVVAGDTITEFAQSVKACLLGQASAAIVAREIIGTTKVEFHAVAVAMERMLKEGGPAPTGRWSDLGYLAPVRDYPHRHASTLLVFEAVEAALREAKSADLSGSKPAARANGAGP